MNRSIQTLPFSLRWIAKKIALALGAAGRSQQEIWTALGNVFLLRYIAPSITNPEPNGILVDTPISTIARRNLGIISRTLRDINRGNFPREEYLAPLVRHLQRLRDVELPRFFAKMIDIEGDTDSVCYSPFTVNHRGRRRVVGITTAEIFALQEMLQTVASDKDHKFAGVVQQLPESGPNLEDQSVLVVSLGTEQTIGGLLSEKDVLKYVQSRSAGQSVAEPQSGADGASASGVGGIDVTTDAVQKLRACLSEVSFPLQWRHLNFVEVLEAQHNEASALGHQHLDAALTACLRRLRQLPPDLLVDGAKKLITALKDDYLSRQPYVSYLVSTKESLNVTKGILQKQVHFFRKLCSSVLCIHVTAITVGLRATCFIGVSKILSSFESATIFRTTYGFRQCICERLPRN